MSVTFPTQLRFVLLEPALREKVWSSGIQVAKFPISLPKRSSAERAMYAVFEDGSRQYRVSEGDVVKVDYRDVAIGAPLEFPRVLLYQGPEGLQIGQPTVEGVRVLGEVVDHPSIKLYIQHFRRRKNYRRLRGHRQPYTSVRVRSILLPGMEPSPQTETAPSPASQQTPAGLTPVPQETPAAPTPAGSEPPASAPAETGATS
jgi:large subunit ribosomal protein L21